MPGSILVARILGIDIRIHLSWFLIFGLLLLSLADRTGFLGQLLPDVSQQGLVVVAAVTAVLFFSSVLIHELAHALVARVFRMPVSSITLFILGGVANLAKEPPSARAEFLMAVAGPLTSLLLGGIGVLIWLLTGGTLVLERGGLEIVSGDPAIVSVPALYLGTVNLVLSAFNMIPGFPLDGGRVLRSIVWGISRDRATATRFAARGGQLVAAALFIYAITRFLDGESFGGVWMAFIAYFLYTAASSSLEQERISSAVAGVRVAELMTTSFHAVAPGVRVAELVERYFLPLNARAIAVVEGSALSGVVTIRDLRKVAQREWADTNVAAVMTPARELPELGPGSRLMTAIERFASADLAAIPVVEDGRLVGMLERDSVLSYVRMREMLGLDRHR